MVVNNNHAKTGKKFDLRTVCEHKRLICVKNAPIFRYFRQILLEGSKNRRTFASSSREN
jgi:hypothetical protein